MLCVLKEKVISERKIVGKVKEINIQYGVLEVVEEDLEDVIKMPEISVFMDGEIRTRKGIEPELSGVYGKIIKVEGNQILVRITHLNKDFKAFVEGIKNYVKLQ